MHPRAGRLELLLQDPESALRSRQFGKTDEAHVIRTSVAGDRLHDCRAVRSPRATSATVLPLSNNKEAVGSASPTNSRTCGRYPKVRRQSRQSLAAQAAMDELFRRTATEDNLYVDRDKAPIVERIVEHVEHQQAARSMSRIDRIRRSRW